jgi:hypothetical protein
VTAVMKITRLLNQELSDVVVITGSLYLGVPTVMEMITSMRS